MDQSWCEIVDGLSLTTNHRTNGLCVSVHVCAQMFVVDSVSGQRCRLTEFSVTGSTYAPEGEV